MEVVYSAFGRAFVEHAAISAASVKRHMPWLKTLLVTDLALTSPYFDRVEVVPRERQQGYRQAKWAKMHKVTAIEAASDEEVLYLDADTYVMADISKLFDAPATWDVALALDSWQTPEIYRIANDGLPTQAPPSGEPFYNTGVMFARKSRKVMRFLRDWASTYAESQQIALEQLVFREKLYASTVACRTLPPSYNLRASEQRSPEIDA